MAATTGIAKEFFEACETGKGLGVPTYVEVASGTPS
jgi:hypothetical protein